MAEDVKVRVALDGVTSVQQGLARLGQTFQDALGSKGLLVASALAVAATGFVKLVQEAAKTGEELLRVSKMTGVSVEQLSLLKFAAEQSETSLAGVATGFRFLAKQMTEANKPGSETAAVFKALGVETTDTAGRGRDLLQVMLDVADRFKRMEDPALKSALAMQLFGRSGVELLPFLSEGRDGIEKLMGKAKDLGLEMSGATAKAADDFGDQLKELNANFDALAVTVGTKTLPTLNAFLGLLNEMIQKGPIDALNDQIDAITGEGRFAAKPQKMEMQPSFGKSLDALKGSIKEVTAELDKADASYKKFEETQVRNALRKKELDKAAADAAKAQREAVEKLFDSYLALHNQEVEQVAAGTKIQHDALKDYLDVRRAYRETDEDYFRQYARWLRDQGYSTERVQMELARHVQDLAKDRSNAEQKARADVVTTNELMRTAAQGTANALKGIWHGNTTTFRDAWTAALDNFVDVLAEMVVQAQATGQAINLQMAAASSGITLVVGMLAMVFGGHGKKDTKVEQATQAFLASIKQTLTQFEKDVLSSLDRLTRGNTRAAESIRALQNIFKAASDTVGSGTRIIDFRALIISNLETLKTAIEERYEIEKATIGEVTDLLKRQRDFVKDMTASITDVQRAFFTPQELFAAQQGDIAALQQVLGRMTGPDRLQVIQDLKQAYLDSFRTAQDVFGQDPVALHDWQQTVISGLEALRDAGVSTYDAMIQAQLDILGVQREGVDLQGQMVRLLAQLNAIMTGTASQPSIFTLLGQIATAPVGRLSELVGQLTLMLQQMGFRMLAKGGVVTRPTLALVGEAGPEAVVPLNRAGRFGGGITVEQHFHGDAVLDEISAVRYGRRLAEAIKREQARYAHS